MLTIVSPAGKRWWSRSLKPELVLVAMLLVPARGGNTTCLSKQLDWYTSIVGESPCKLSYSMLYPCARLKLCSGPGMTYQRLRQICNHDCKSRGPIAAAVERATSFTSVMLPKIRL